MIIHSRSLYPYFRFFLVLHLIVIGAFYLAIGGYLALGSLSKADLLDLSGKPLGSDFLPFWAAPRLALTVDPAAVFSREELYAVEREVICADFPPRTWPYPPTFLLLLLPLALLPYPLAFLVWLTATGLGYLQVIRGVSAPGRLFWLFPFFPGAVSNFLYGQNGFLSAALLGGGLLLAERHPFGGGCLLGLLSYKPQLAFLVPMALAFGRYWRTLLGAVAGAAVLALAGLGVLGLNVWTAFFENLPLAAGVLNRPYQWVKMPTVFAAARLAGAGPEPAAVLQAVSTAAVILVIALVWRGRAPLPVRASALAAGIFLATPFAFDYDLTILALAFAWLGWQAHTHDSKFQETLLLLTCSLLAWATLGPSWILSWASPFPFKPAVLAVLLSLAAYRAANPFQEPSPACKS